MYRTSDSVKTSWVYLMLMKSKCYLRTKARKPSQEPFCYSRNIALSPTAVAFATRAMAYLKLRRQVTAALCLCLLGWGAQLLIDVILLVATIDSPSSPYLVLYHIFVNFDR